MASQKSERDSNPHLAAVLPFFVFVMTPTPVRASLGQPLPFVPDVRAVTLGEICAIPTFLHAIPIVIVAPIRIVDADGEVHAPSGECVGGRDHRRGERRNEYDRRKGFPHVVNLLSY